MSEATIRAQLKTTLAAVTDVINVHDYVRYSNDVTYLESLFLNINDDLFHGWMITLESAPQNRAVTEVQTFKRTTASIQRLRDFNYALHGYYGLDDSAGTEKTFMVIIEAVMDGFDSDTTLHATGNNVFHNVTAIQLNNFEHRLFAGRLCHYAELQIQITSLVS